MFNYLEYKNKIPLHKCVLEIPKLNPLSINYEKFWIHTMKRKQIEGHWVEHNDEWKWMPGPIFQYVNLWTIELKKKDGSSKGKVLGKPRLRDLEWIKGYVHAVARGFSGFNEDDDYSCHRMLINPDKEELIPYLNKETRDSLMKPDGTYKEYIPALEYLYKYFDRCLGKPLYLNNALNVVDIEARNLGKSFISANFAAHNFLTDGVMDFDEWWKNRQKPKLEQEKFTTQTLIGAIDSKYSGGVCTKIKIGLDNLPGKQQIGEILYPPPLSKIYSGSWVSGKDIVALYEDKTGGRWEKKGSGSGFLHRSFKDNEFAANGTRYGFGVIDEIGFMGNLEPTLGQLAECTTADGGDKYGTIWMTGTGGDMEGGATEAVKRVFYSPSSYDCLEFDDICEGTPHKIGFFIPAWMSFDKYRDELGNVNKALAMRDLLKEREKAKAAKSKAPLNDLLQMKPLIPSEAFLVSGGNIFDRPELGEWIGKLETMADGYKEGLYGDLYIDSDSTVKFRVNLDARPTDYPMQQKDDLTGCIVIWDQPIENPPYSYYIASLDPYAQDEAPNSQSLGSMQIFKRSMIGGSSFDEQVAEYTGRPATAREFFENCRKLLIYYNATCLYENNYNAFKEYMQNRNCLHYLAYEPTVLKPRTHIITRNSSNTGKVYGLRMHNSKTGVSTNGLKDELEIYTRDWLYEDAGDGSLNLHHIYSVPLLKELKSYNDVGNFDRVISLMLIVALKKQLHQVTIQRKEDIKKSEWATRTYY